MGTPISSSINTENRETPRGHHYVDLVIVNISKNVNDDDKDATKLTGYLDQDVFRRLRSVSVMSDEDDESSFLLPSLESLLNDQQENDPAIAGKLRKGIVRFVQSKDRYAALASLLMKRQALFQAVCHMNLNDPEQNNDNHTPNTTLCPPSFPLVDLPRTIHKKPYIPKFVVGQQNEEWFPFSISHQHPFVGMACPGSRTDSWPTTAAAETPLSLGFDIVVFDDYNPRLYNNVTEFVNVFRSSFAPLEQAILNRLMEKATTEEANLHLLRELYLMWSVKEAYTKALGVGLGFDFSSFATRLDDFDPDRDSLWQVLSSSLPEGPERRSAVIRRPATISFMDGRPGELWKFGFLFLWANDDTGPPQGCACVCWGPGSNNQDIGVTVNFCQLQELVNG